MGGRGRGEGELIKRRMEAGWEVGGGGVASCVQPHAKRAFIIISPIAASRPIAGAAAV